MLGRGFRYSLFPTVLSKSIAHRVAVNSSVSRWPEVQILLGEPSADYREGDEERPWTGNSAASLQKRTSANLAPSPSRCEIGSTDVRG